MPGGTFALSSLPLAFFFVQAKKKTDILTIQSNLYEICPLQKTLAFYLFCHTRKLPSTLF